MRAAVARATAATWTAARSYGHGEERGYGVQAAKRREGNGAGAHCGSGGVFSGLGGGQTAAWRRGRSPAAGDEDDGAEDEAELARLLCSVRREKGSRRSWEACRGGAAVAEATVAVDGGDGDFGRERGSEGEERMARERAREAWGGHGDV